MYPRYVHAVYRWKLKSSISHTYSSGCISEVVSDSLRPHELQPTRFLRPWDFPGKITGMGCHCVLQEIFLTQGLSLGLLHCRQKLYRLSLAALDIGKPTLENWNISLKLNTRLPYDSISPAKYTQKHAHMFTHRTLISVLAAALFVIALNWKLPKYPPPVKWGNKWWHIPIKEECTI